MTRAGTPTAVAQGGTSSMTTAPAPTTAPSPTERHWMTCAPMPTNASGPTPDGRAGQGGVGVEEADGVVPAGGPEDVEDDLAVAAGADDDDLHARLRWFVYRTCGADVGSQNPEARSRKPEARIQKVLWR